MIVPSKFTINENLKKIYQMMGDLEVGRHAVVYLKESLLGRTEDILKIISHFKAYIATTRNFKTLSREKSMKERKGRKNESWRIVEDGRT